MSDLPPSTAAVHDDEPARRQALRYAGIGVVGLGALGACGSDQGEPEATSTSSQASPVPTADPTADPTTPAPAVETPAGDPAPSGTLLVALADVPVGQATVVDVGAGHFVAVAQPSTGRAVAFEGACTHKGCPVMAMEGVLVCHCHGSEFDMLSGKRLAGPAKKPLPPVAVIVANGLVFAPDL